MQLSVFLQALFEHGHVRVGSPRGALEADDLLAADKVLLAVERVRRDDFPSEAPGWDAAAGRWAAVVLYRLCQLTAYRDLGADAIAPLLGEPWAGEVTAAVHYSVDLPLQFLPEVNKLARGVSPEDPLLLAIRGVAAPWPLSSVGLTGPPDSEPAAVIAHPGLLQFYAERIVGRGASDRLRDPRVRAAARGLLGMHLELAPTIGAALDHLEPPV